MTSEETSQAIEEYITFYSKVGFQKKTDDLFPIEHREKVATFFIATLRIYFVFRLLTP